MNLIIKISLIKLKLFTNIKIFKFIFKFLVKFINFTIIFSAVFLLLLFNWLKSTFNNTSFENILFNLFMPVKGVEQTLIKQFLNKCLIPAVVYGVLIFIIVNWLIILTKKNTNNIISHKIFKKNNIFNIIINNKHLIFNVNFINKFLNIKINRKLLYFSLIFLEISFLTLTINNGVQSLKISDYFKKNKQSSTFIKDNYVDPNKIKITFPKKKQNLIYIFAESLESSFFSKNLGGNENFNLMQPLTKLTMENLNFSNNNQIGGAFCTTGSTFTTAGLVSQTLGIPLKISSDIINHQQNHSKFLNNVCGLGNILQKAGYKQIFLIGSDKKFGNRNILMKNHGNYEIYDYFSAINEGDIPSNYKIWWGFEDSKLFQIAKNKLKKLAKNKQPFNLTLLTTNTHCPEGFVEKNCKLKFSDPYSNAIYYSAMQIQNFIEWIKKQKFFKNTTIIVVGDHLSMARKHFENYSKTYPRTIYNLFINYKAKPLHTKNRVFTSQDLFPTTLASLGCKIDGEKLGLGTNLFSNFKTLAEIYGINYLNTEFKKNSNFYNINFIYS